VSGGAEFVAMQDLDWQRRARGRSGRSKPGRPSRGFFWALKHVQLRDPRAFKKMTPDERRKARNKRKAARRAARCAG